MKKLTTSMLACGVLASGLLTAAATPTLRLSADGGATWTVIQDNDGVDETPAAGSVKYTGLLGGWALSINSGQSTGTPGVPNLDLITINVSKNPATLIVQFSDTGFTTFPSETYIANVSVSTDGSITHNTYRDSGNVLFGTTQTYSGGPAGSSPSPTALLVYSTGPVSGNTVLSNGVVVTAVGSVPNSLTLETVITHSGTASTTVDAHIFALPQPPSCNCTLTFSGPSNVTNCPDDTIPGITASQVCGTAGSVSVPVSLVSSSTNGSCPAIITRNFTATDSCGTVHPFTQTIRVNCKPDCTITTSVLTADIGSTNTASVPDAGPGATYVWSVLNGTIVSGQGTKSLTWKAGSDTNSPVTIHVIVTAATGCQSSCTASVKLTAPPPGFGSGDAATIGFWHNKNGQGIITNAPNSPALGNWLATTFPCLYGANAPAGDNMTGKANSVVAALFMTKFGLTGQAKQESQILAVAFACYFTDTTLGGGAGPSKFGFNQSPGGTGAKLFNVGQYGTALGLQNNTSYTILQILQAANSVRCGNPSAAIPYDLFDSINSSGDIK